jgi:osmotically-inducible protein OsmY
MKKSIKTLVWLATPVLLIAGCSQSHRDSSVSYSPALMESQSVTPTSDRSDIRAYPEQPSDSDISVVPQGASTQDWALAQEIRSMLMSDRKLGNAPMAAVVNNGVVTLKGDVRNEKDRQRLHDAIARLPGVQRVEDEMEFKNPLDKSAGETKNY